MECQMLMRIMEKNKVRNEMHLKFKYSGSGKVSLKRFHFSEN